MNNLSYYDVGTPEDPRVSSSSLKELNPEQGGSIISFLNFFREKTEKNDSLALERGKLIHSYIEKPDNFIIADIEKPTEMMSGLLERVVKGASDFKGGVLNVGSVDTVITSALKTESAKSANIQGTLARYETLGNNIGLSTEDAIRVFRTTRGIAYKSTGEEALLSSILEETKSFEYLKFLLGCRNKIVLEAAEGNKVRGAITSLTNHPKVSALLGLKQDELSLQYIDDKVYSEVPVYWQETIAPFDNPDKKIKINCKALLDKIRINHKRKTITTIDLKGTKESLYRFQNAFEYYRYYRQMAFYQRAIIFWFKALFPDYNIADYTPTVLMVPVETHGNFLTGIYNVSMPWQYKGKREILPLLSRLAWHQYVKEYRYSYEEIKGNGILNFTNPIEVTT